MIMRLLRACFFLIIFPCLFCFEVSPANVSAATDANLTEFLAGIEAEAAQVHTLSCTFIQEKHLSVFAQPVIFHGTLNLVRPDRLRWELVTPVPSVFILKGESGIRCNDQDPPYFFDLKTDPVMQVVARQLWTWLGGRYSLLSQSYHLKMVGRSSISITPKDKNLSEFVTAITISFDLESKQPQKVEIVEPGGDLTRILFHEYRLNRPPDEALFARCYKSE